jgi:hypothetical protein
MQIAFYKANRGNLLDKLIGVFTFGKYSHCELILDDGLWATSSPRDGGVVMRYLEPSDKWDIFDLYVPYDVNTDLVKKWFDANDGDAYDYLGAFGSAFGLDLVSTQKKYCSQTCAIILGIDSTISPSSLYRKLKKIGYIR